MTHKCSKCQTVKDASEFYRDRWKKHGIRRYCKKCTKATALVWKKLEPFIRRVPPGKTYLQRLDEIPPPLCRLIARTDSHRPRLLHMHEIAAAAGLTWQRCAKIAMLKSFARVPIEDAEKFRRGCGITLENEHHQKEFIRRNVKRPNGWEKYLKAAQPHWPAKARPQFVRRILKRL